MKTRNVTSPRAAIAAVLTGIWLMAGGGCASLSVSKVTEVFEKDEPIVSPSSLAVVWTTTVIEKPGAVATRGFGGVVTFFAGDQTKPVRVDGELTIYAYDEIMHNGDDSAPDRKYVFTREQLAKHYGEGPTGPAYHIWIPWDEIGRPRQEVGLILRFDPPDGRAILSKPTHAVLPGPTDERDRLSISRRIDLTPLSHGQPAATAGQEAAPSSSRAGASQAAATTPSPTASAAASTVKVTTLNLPSRGLPRAESTAPQSNGTAAQQNAIVPQQNAAAPDSPQTEPRPVQTEPRP